jgi:hypothetical protein
MMGKNRKKYNRNNQRKENGLAKTERDKKTNEKTLRKEKGTNVK